MIAAFPLLLWGARILQSSDLDVRIGQKAETAKVFGADDLKNESVSA
jgi:hypothetical protein